MGLATARAQAREALAAIAAGFDPAGEKRAVKATPAAAVKPVDTFARITQLFITQYAALHTKTWAETARLLNKEVVPLWGDRLFVDITRAEVNEFLRGIVNAGMPYKANHALAYLRKLYNWAIEEGYAEHSPCDRVKKKGREEKRDRALSDDEIRIV